MAVTVTNSATTVWDCESTTGAVGNKPGLEAEILKQGSNSVGFTTTQTNTISGFDGTIPNSGDLSGEHIRLWYTSITFPNMDVKANGGLCFYISDGTNTSYWFIGGKDTYYGGWINICVYSDSTPDLTSGTAADTSSITEIGMSARSGTGGSNAEYLVRPKNMVNVWVDYFRFGDGISVHSTTSFGMEELYQADLTGGYGITEKVEGTYLLSGSVEMGDSVGTNDCTYTDSNVDIKFTDKNVLNTLYRIEGSGNTTGTTSVSFVSCSIKSNGEYFDLDMDATNLSSLTIIGTSFANGDEFKFQDAQTITGNTFNSCGEIRCSGSTFESNTISNTVATTSTGSLYIDATGTAADMNTLVLNTYSDASKYAVYVPAGVTSFSMDNWQFDDPNNTDGYAVYWAGTGGTLTISSTNGTNLQTGGCTTAGGTVSISQDVAVEITNIIPGSRVRVDTVDGNGSLSTNLISESASGTSVSTSVNYAGLDYTAVSIRVRKGSDGTKYLPYSASGTISSGGLSASVNQVVDTIVN